MKRGDLLVWGVLYIVLGLLILANKPPVNAGIYMLIAGVAFIVGLAFLFRLSVRRR